MEFVRSQLRLPVESRHRGRKHRRMQSDQGLQRPMIQRKSCLCRSQSPRLLRDNGRMIGQFQRLHAHRRDHAFPCAIPQWNLQLKMELKTRRISRSNGEEMHQLTLSCHRRRKRQQHQEESTVRLRPALAPTSGRPWTSNVH